MSIGFASNGAVDPSDPDGYKALFKERFAQARQVGLHYTATNCLGREAIPDLSEGDVDYYKCEHYKSPDDLRAATLAVFTDDAAQDLLTRFEDNAFIERDGRPLYLSAVSFEASPWSAQDTITVQGQTVDTFLWDGLTVKAEDSRLYYTLDWYQTYPGDPIRSVFTLVQGADGVWRFDECFGEADNMMVAYVDETLSEAEARAILSQIEQNPNVEYADFVTRRKHGRACKKDTRTSPRSRASTPVFSATDTISICVIALRLSRRRKRFLTLPASSILPLPTFPVPPTNTLTIE